MGGGGGAGRRLSAPLFPNDDTLILEDSTEVKSVVMVPNKAFQWGSSSDFRC